MVGSGRNGRWCPTRISDKGRARRKRKTNERMVLRGRKKKQRQQQHTKKGSGRNDANVCVPTASIVYSIAIWLYTHRGRGVCRLCDGPLMLASLIIQYTAGRVCVHLRLLLGGKPLGYDVIQPCCNDLHTRLSTEPLDNSIYILYTQHIIN